MNKKKWGYKAYFPDDGEGPNDARELETYPWVRIYDADDAAEQACEHDYSGRDGWERGATTEFPIVIIAPDGTESRYVGWHEPSVEHKTRRIDGDEDRERVQDGEGAGRQDQDRPGSEGAAG